MHHVQIDTVNIGANDRTFHALSDAVWFGV